MADHGRSATLRLEPIAGPAVDPVVVVAGSRTVLGRSTLCDVCLPDAGVSRRHLALTNSALTNSAMSSSALTSAGAAGKARPDAGSTGTGQTQTNTQWMVEDLGSRHGTTLNSVGLEPHKPVPITRRDLLRIGPFIFRVATAGPAQTTMTNTDATMAPGSHIESVSSRELEALAHQRLALLIDGCGTVLAVRTQAQLARAVVDLVRSGTGFPRAAMLRWDGSLARVEIVASHDSTPDPAPGFVLSRSLLEASTTGQTARLTKAAPHDYGQSIDTLGIAEALCAPLVVDELVVGAIYLDARDSEPHPQRDAAGFCHAVSQIASLALANLRRIELAQRQERFDAELRIAQEAQAFLMPTPSGVAGSLRYASRTRPGSMVGGDLFDIFAIDDTRTGICFGDITGHGVGAAILMTAVLAHLRAVLSSTGDPVAAVAQANTYLAGHSADRMFATLWVGVFDPADGSLAYVDAGHGHWLVCKAGAPPTRPSMPDGLVIGVQHDYAYAAQRCDLRPGDRLILYSDGLTEQADANSGQFGADRLARVIAESCSIDDDITGVFRALEAFIGSSRFDDDTTIASIERADASAGAAGSGRDTPQ